MSATVLAVDGGNSKTDVVIVTGDGVVLAAERGPGCFGQSPAETVATLATTLDSACMSLDRSGSDGPVADVGAYCLSGVDFDSDRPLFESAIDRRRWTTRSIVENDAIAVLMAGSDSHVGVAVVCGTGINCIGVGHDGQRIRFPALGALSGDWGGGYDLGLAALAAATRSADGRDRHTVLEADVLDFLEVSTPLEAIEAVHRKTISRARLAELAPVVFAAGAAGDEVAQGLIERLVSEAAAMALSAIRRLNLEGEAFDVVLGGGMFQGASSLATRVVSAIQAAAPGGRPTVLSDPPVLGAVILGLDEIGASRAAHRRIRASHLDEHLFAQVR